MKFPRSGPPQFAKSFLQWFCKEEIVEEITGDLHEIWLEESEIKGKNFARVLYIIRVISFCKFSNIAFKNSNNNLMLFKNYILIAFRNFIKYKNHTSFNLMGLVIGLTASILMIKYVSDELSFDKQYNRHEDIYRVAQHINMETSEMTAAISPSPLGKTLLKEIPEVESFAAFSFFNNMAILVDNQKFFNSKAHYVSTNFLEIFDYPLIKGNPENVFSNPKSVLISESVALRYYGTTDLLGKTLEDVNAGTLTITGIMEDPPTNSHFTPEILYNTDNGIFENQNWGDHSYYTYIKLKEGSDLALVNHKLISFYENNLQQPIADTFGGTGNIFLQRISNIHLFSDLTFEISTNNKYRNVITMLLLAIFIVIVACINYTNLATAQSTRRVKEIGVRKVLGSNKKMILYQFYTESALITCLSAFIAILLIPILLPLFNSLTGKDYALMEILELDIMIYYVGIILLAGFLGAIYPAFFLGRFKVDEIFRKSYNFGKFKLPVNKLLNAFQFLVALVMIIMTVTVYLQIDFVKNKELGFNKDNIFKVDLKQWPGTESGKVIKQALLTNPSILDASIVRQVPGDRIMSDGLFFETPDGSFSSIQSEFNGVDENYVNLLKINLVAGRNFTTQVSDIMGKTVIVNEKLIQSLGYLKPEDALGKKVKLPLGEDHVAKIIGVIENVHLQSLHNEVLPHIMTHFTPMGSQLLVKVKNEGLWSTHDFIDNQLKEITKSTSHIISFLDQAYWEQYKADERRSEILTLFSIIIVFLSLAGLIGLVSFQIRYQAKEVNIRKVFGAEFYNILVLYIKQYVWQISIALLIALPIAIYLMNEWLISFAYHIDIPYMVLILTPLVLVSVIFIILAFKIKFSFQDSPAKYLKEN